LNLSKRITRILYVSFLFVCVLILSVLILPRILWLLLPFIIGYIIATAIEPGVTFMSRKLKFSRKISGAILVILVISALTAVIISAVSRIVTEINFFVSRADLISEKITSALQSTEEFINGLFKNNSKLLFNTKIDFSVIGKNISDYINGYIGPAIKKAISFLRKLPNALVFTATLIFSTYFISVDKEKITEKLKNSVPRFIRSYTSKIKPNLTRAFSGYIKAQALLMGITFIELTTGFFIIGGEVAKYAVILGLIISIIDVLPVLGTGTVLIPWAVISLFIKNIRLGISLIILYGICVFVRQMLEPKFIGKQIGLHPLITLMTMYTGLNLFGIIGMISGPVVALIIKALAESGLFTTVKLFITEGE